MKAVVHLGMHKAASTYLQSLVKHNRQALADAGVRAMTRHGHAELKATTNSPRPIRNAHSMLSQYVAEADRGNDVSSYSHALLTDEALEFLVSDGLNFGRMERKLRQLFSEVCYFVVVRDPLAFQASMVQQRAKTFRIYDNQLPKVRTGKPLFMHPLNYLHRFRALLGSERNAVFMPMHELTDVGGPVALNRLMRDEFGIAPVALEDVSATNSGIGARGVAFASFFRYCMLQSLGGKPLTNRIRQRMKKHLLRHCQQHGWDRDRYFPFDADYLARLQRRLAKVKERFAEKAWGKTWREVFAEENQDLSIFDWDRIDREQAAQLESVFDQFMYAFHAECDEVGLSTVSLPFKTSLTKYLIEIRGLSI